jgi:cytidine deaminase
MTEILDALSNAAWTAREKARAIRTKVGAAVLADDPPGVVIYAGCNIEDQWKCGSIHAERAAITHALIHGATRITDILVCAEREGFYPCGLCLDFIMQWGGPDCRVWIESKPGERACFRADELMPRYPR